MYITDYNRQLELISEMRQLRRDTQKVEVYYHHPYSNQMWKSFFPRANEQKLGPKLLRHEPVPSNIEENLEICLTEEDPENAIGLGIEWSVKAHLWNEIIQELEQHYSNYLRKQLKLFLKHLRMSEIQQVERENETDQSTLPISEDQLNELVWRSRKIRMKRFFVLG